jgi:hypothetical protein
MMEFKYLLRNNGVDVPLFCQCDYDWSSDRGAEACLVSVTMGPDKPNVVKLLKKQDRLDIEEYYLENAYQIEQEHSELARRARHEP